MSKNNRIKIDKDNREFMISQIIEYFGKERDEEIGYLAASLILDFVSENLGPLFYNQGVKDSIAFMSDKVEDMYGLEI